MEYIVFKLENPWWKLEIPFHRISSNLGQLKYIYYSNYLMFSTIIQQNKNNNEEILKKLVTIDVI